MYHQFKELAEVDITAEAMEVGPTCHYVMGGVEVDPESAAAVVPGLYAAGEVAGGMHGSNRLGGNSLSDLLVFGRRAGAAAAARAKAAPAGPLREADLTEAAAAALAPFEREGGENPYTVHQALQAAMNELVGIIRTAPEVEQALGCIEELKARAKALTVEGQRQYNPGWHLALDLPHMLRVSECIAKGCARARGEPRRPHPGRLPRAARRVGRAQRHLHRRRGGHRPVPQAAAGHARRPGRDLRGVRVIRAHDAEGTRNELRGEAARLAGGRHRWRPAGLPGEVNEGEVVLDILHRLQATQTPDLAVRWNCKAGKCGSCSARSTAGRGCSA
jgi:hypothetical protein